MDFPLTLVESILAFLITTCGAALQGSIGFGLGLIGVPLLVMLNPIFVPGPVLLSALCLTVLIARRERQAIKFKEITWAVAGRIAGAAVGSFLLTVIPRKNVSILFGAMILLAVIISVSGIRLQLKPINLLGAGTASGIMGTTSAIGGAPM
ncbi:MAG TPA: sulfite exporter TauE/SafE family protein, partial [Acidobacteriota bacterium]|nr:sulfite exporter TauE/SafE family protein [Acidobacteriota bacterium]